MPDSGWIKLYRKIRENWVWDSKEPFDKRSAWVDILLMVNHKKGKTLLGNELIEVDRGERITSERKLAEKWNWSRTKVRSFLELLEKEKMIKIKRDKKKTTLKVLNYSVYQETENHKKTTKKPQKNLNKNEKNEKNYIKHIYEKLPEKIQKLFSEYINVYRQKNKTKEISDNRHQKLLGEIYKIYQEKKFFFDGQEYNLTDTIFEYGLNEIIKREVDNLNYAKKVWINQIEKGGAKKQPQEGPPTKGMTDEEREKYYRDKGYIV